MTIHIENLFSTKPIFNAPVILFSNQVPRESALINLSQDSNSTSNKPFEALR